MKRFAAMLCGLWAACSFGQSSPPLSVTVDFSARIAPAIEIYQANERVFNVTLVNKGILSLTNLTPTMWWAVSSNSSSIVTGAVSILNTNAGLFQVAFSPSQLNTNGTFIYGVGATGSGYTTARQGQFVIKPDPYATGANPITFGTNLNWALISSYIGTAAYGPYRVGSGMTATTNTDGSLTLAAGAGTVDLSFTNLYYRANNPSNYCTLAAAVAWTNGLEFGSHTGLPYYPANNPSGYVSSAGATYTFANTNAAIGVYTNGTVVWIGTNATAVGTVAHSDTTGRNDDVDYQHITTGDVARIGAAVLTNDIGQIGAIYAEKGIVIISGNTGNGDTNILGTYYNEGEGLWYKWEGGSFLFEQTVWPDELFLSTVPETTNYYANGWTNLIPGTLFGNGSYIGTTVTVSYLEATNWSGNPDTKILIVDGRLSNATLQGSTAASGALTLNGSPVLTNLTAAAIAAAGGVTGTPWQTSWYVSSNVLGDVASGTLTVTRAMGPSIWIAPTSAIVITADTSTFPTNGDSSFSFAHFGTNQVTWVTSIITNETALTTNTWNSRIFWKGFGQTIFDGVKAGL